MPPRFSVIIPSYNRWPMVRDAVESALAQSLPCHEIIVVDDGSADGTSEKLREEYGARIVVIEKENGGVSTARNTGVSAATGNYIAYLDSDDLWERDWLLTVSEAIALTGSKPAFLFCDFRRYETRTETFYSQTNTQLFPRIYRRFSAVSEDIYRAEGLEALQCVVEDYPFFPSTFVLHHTLHDNYRWDPAVRYSEDFNFVAKIAERYPMVYIDKPLATVRMHGSNKSSNWRAKLDSHMRTLKAAELRAIDEATKARCVRRALGRKNLSAARQFLRERDYGAAIHYALQALRYPSYFVDAGRDFLKRDLVTPIANRGNAARQV